MDPSGASRGISVAPGSDAGEKRKFRETATHKSLQNAAVGLPRLGCAFRWHISAETHATQECQPFLTLQEKIEEVT